MRYEAVGGGCVGWEGGRGGGTTGTDDGGGSEVVSQDREADALLSIILPGSKGMGRVSRCSRKET